MKDSTLRRVMFGHIDGSIPNPSSTKRIDIIFGAMGEGDKDRKISYPAADGLILYLIKRIEILENEVGKLQHIINKR